MSKVTITEYQNTKEILKFTGHEVSKTVLFKTVDGTAVGGKTIVKKGTIFPSNDASAIGVVLNDIDVTDGEANGALLIHGFVDKTKLPVAPTDLAKGAMPMISFL